MPFAHVKYVNRVVLFEQYVFENRVACITNIYNFVVSKFSHNDIFFVKDGFWIDNNFAFSMILHGINYFPDKIITLYLMIYLTILDCNFFWNIHLLNVISLHILNFN